MKNLFKVLSIACIVAMVPLLFTGCGSTKNSNTPSSATVEPTKPVSLRFSWWGDDTRHKATLAVFDFYKTKHPNVTVEGEYSGYDGYQDKLTTELASNSAPDIIQINFWLTDLVKKFNSFADINTLSSIDTKGFDEKFLKDFGIIDNKLYGLPTGLNALTMYINKDILTKANIKADQVWDWDTIISEGQKVNQLDSNSYFMNFDQNGIVQYIFRPYIKQRTGNPFFNADYTLGFDKADVVEAFTYIKKLFDTKVNQPASESFMFKANYQQNPIWVNNKVGANIDWASSTVPRVAGFKASADVANIPIVKDAKDTAVLIRPSQLLCINSNSVEIEEVAKFVNFFFNDKDAQLILKDARGVPPTEAGRKVCSDAKLIDPLVSKAIDLANTRPGIAENTLSATSLLDPIMIDAVEKAVYGKSTIEAAADDMIKQLNAKLLELKG